MGMDPAYPEVPATHLCYAAAAATHLCANHGIRPVQGNAAQLFRVARQLAVTLGLLRELYEMTSAFASLSGIQRAAVGHCENMVKEWDAPGYAFHVKLTGDDGYGGYDMSVLFSKPEPDRPVPPHICTVFVRVNIQGQDDPYPSLSYRVESESTQRQSRVPLQVGWIDRIIERKGRSSARTEQFARTKTLPEGRAFAPGEYKVAETLELAADQLQVGSCWDAAEQGLAYELQAEQYALETAAELEATIAAIFDDADINRDGKIQLEELHEVMRTLPVPVPVLPALAHVRGRVLCSRAPAAREPRRSHSTTATLHVQVMRTADLNLSDTQVRQLLQHADRNDDGQLEYAEFVPLAVEVRARPRTAQD